MYYFVTSSKDASLYLQQPTQNTGLDEVLEVSKVYYGSLKDTARSLIKFDINGDKSEPYFTGTKRIHPLKSLKAFIEEFKMQNISVKANDYLLCGSLIHPYKIKKKWLYKDRVRTFK